MLWLGEWALRDPGLKQAAHREKLDEERQLAERRDGRGRIPLDMDAPPERIERDRPVPSCHSLAWCLTQGVTPFVPRNTPLLRFQQGYTGAILCFNCRL